jgi:hypothetical protein
MAQSGSTIERPGGLRAQKAVEVCSEGKGVRMVKVLLTHDSDRGHCQSVGVY